MSSGEIVIDKFMELYARNLEKWEAIAEKVKTQCQQIMTNPKGPRITALYMHRAKTKKSLRMKLEDRNKKRSFTTKGEFRNEDDIYNEIPDLAGVRIVLYFPTESRDVEEAIFGNFSILETKAHNGSRVPPTTTAMPGYDLQERKFIGYTAKHYITDVAEDKHMLGLEAEDLPLGKPVVEIQVMSLIHHVWSEIEHAIEYKAYGDRPTLTERTTLDSLNGLVLTGERVIETLYVCRTRARQNKSPGTEFNNRNELEVFIQDKQSTFCKCFYGDSGLVLSAFLHRFKMFTPQSLEPILNQLGQAKQSNPCSRLVKLGFEIDAASWIMLQILQNLANSLRKASSTELGSFTGLDSFPELKPFTELERSIVNLILGQTITMELKDFNSLLDNKFKDSAYRLGLIRNSLSWIVELFGSQRAFQSYWREIAQNMRRSMPEEEGSLYDVICNQNNLVYRVEPSEDLDTKMPDLDIEKPVLQVWNWLVRELKDGNPVVGLGFGISLLKVERELTVRIMYRVRMRLLDLHANMEPEVGASSSTK